MSASGRLPNDLKLKGPAMVEVGDEPGKPSKVGPASVVGEEKFEQKGFASVWNNQIKHNIQAKPSPGSPSFEGQAKSRGIKPVDPRTVSASVAGPNVLSGNHNPMRGPGRKTTRDKLTAGS